MSPKLEIRLPQDLIDALRERAESRGEKLSEHVRGILARSLKVAAPEMARGHGGAENPEESARAAANVRWGKRK